MRKPILACAYAALALLAGCSKDPKTLFAGDKPDTPLPLAALKWGTPKAEALTTAGQAGRVLGDGIWVKGYRGLTIDFMFDYPDDTLNKMLISFPEGTNAAELGEKLWGAPTVGQEDGKELKMWVNPEKGVRAYASKAMPDTRMWVEMYSPLETLLGEGKTFAFEAKQPIVGATRAQISAAYKLSDGRIHFPPTRCGKGNVSLLIRWDDHDKATGYDTRFEDGYCSLDGPVVKQLMEKKFGKPRPLQGTPPTDVYADDPNVIGLAPVEPSVIAGMHLPGQGEKGLGLAVFIRPTKGRLLDR